MLDELIDALIAAGHATEGAAFRAYQPADPVRAVILRRYGGANNREDFDGNVIEPVMVQFTFRDATYAAAEAWGHAVWAWCFTAQIILAGVAYLGLTPRGTTIDAGEDDNGNALVTLNVEVARISIVHGVAV